MGICTRSQAPGPTNQKIAPMATASIKFVKITLCLIRGRIPLDQMRGPIISDQSGPIPNMTRGLRKSRYPQPLLRGARGVLLDRQRRHVTGPPPVEVTGGAVVDGVVVAPVRERLEDEETGEPAEPQVPPLRRQE